MDIWVNFERIRGMNKKYRKWSFYLRNLDLKPQVQKKTCTQSDNIYKTKRWLPASRYIKRGISKVFRTIDNQLELYVDCQAYYFEEN